MSATSSRARQVAHLFGIDNKQKAHGWPSVGPSAQQLEQIQRLITPGKLILITGPSGAGKSSLLRALRKKSWIDLDRLPLKDKPVIDLLKPLPTMLALRDLGAIGLGEVWTYLKKPSQLSEGQRWRLKLALALNRAKSPRMAIRGSSSQTIASDEFCALLDRITAKVVSRTLRRAIDSNKTISAIVATSHDDLVDALQPDVVIRCDFGEIDIRVVRGSTTEVTPPVSDDGRRDVGER